MFKLYPYQEPIAERVFTYMRNTKNHPLVGMPTGSGKTVVLADIVLKAVTRWPETKILILSHVKEILQQDYNSLTFHTGLDIGIYSVGLDKRERKQVTVAGIQSVFRKPELFDDYKLIIIDECHLIPPGDSTMYRKFFAGLNNPKYFGLTATPFRLGQGLIYGEENSIFTDMIVDLTSKEQFTKLINDGYLCNLVTKATSTELDTKGIKLVGGDFDNKELSKKFDVKKITKMAIKELIRAGKDRKKWLIFAIDIEHAEHIAEELANNGIPTMVVHSKMEFDRTTVLKHYKQGTFKAVVNVNVLTTGFDDPEIDLIGLLRPTQSPVIHVQTIGRGLRIADGKTNCLVLDFAGNTERLGPINDIQLKKKGKGRQGGEAITKTCPICATIVAPAVRECPECGHKYEFKTALKGSSGGKDVIAGQAPGWQNVKDVTYSIHKKAGSPDMVVVSYQCGLRVFKEYVCVAHKGYSGHKAKHWLSFRGMNDTQDPKWVVEHSHQLKKPNRICVDTSGKYVHIKDYSF